MYVGALRESVTDAFTINVLARDKEGAAAALSAGQPPEDRWAPL